MKRPDVRLACWEKVTIYLLIFLLNGIAIFYIAIFFGRLLCPDFDQAWTTNELAEHTATNDFFVAIQGKVYDVSNFVWGQRSGISG